MRAFDLRPVIIVFLWLGSMTGLEAQRYHFMEYGVSEGLPNSFIYTLQEDEQGFLWVGTGTELVRFDGQRFRKAVLPDTLGQGFVTVSHRLPGGGLWFGFSNGYVGELKGGKFRFYDLTSRSASRVNGIASLPGGDLLVVSQTGGLFRLSPQRSGEVRPLVLPVSQLSALAVAGDEVIIGTFDGAYRLHLDLQGDTVTKVQRIGGLPEIGVQSFCLSGDTLFIGTRGEGVWVWHPGSEKPASVPASLASFRSMIITDLYRDSRGRMWISTMGEGLFRMNGEGSVEHLNEKGLKSRNLQCVFEDFEHNIWIGTYGEGLVFFPEESVLFYDMPSPVPGRSVTALSVSEGRLVAGGEGGVLVRSLVDGKEQRYDAARGLKGMVSALWIDARGDIWAGTAGQGIYRIEKGKVRHPFNSGNLLENTINALEGDEKAVWAGTASGVLKFDAGGTLLCKFSTNEGLPYNNINDIYVDEQHRVWLATMSDGLYVIENDSVRRVYLFPDVITRTQMRSLVRDRRGEFWIGSYGSGVIEISKDTILNYLDKSGLVSNYCYSITTDPRGSIWVGHSMGISRIFPEKMKVRTYTEKLGITAECNANAVCTDEQGRIWFGTTQGLIRFDPSREKSDTIPPRTSILSVTFSDKKVPPGEKIVMPYGRYRVRIDFIGISFQDPREVTYQYKLENYDEGWSEVTTTPYAYYPRLEDGRYTFLLRAYNSSGYAVQQPVALRIIIRKPIWKTWWFISLMVLLLIVIFFIILKIRERNHIRRERYLEEELDKRTHEVVRQKEELEIKNKEITDSINYARRIQRNILPPLKKLREVFPESFVFYLPRDIVSGDFYWWGPVDDGRYLVVCADSTGHGVPGAFMSMIGSTLIKDLTNQGRYESPSQLLRFLDREIVNSLNQDRDGKSNDGMDITVVEVTPATHHIKFASAMRPVVLFIGDELYYIRGNRSGVGGEFTGDKVFDDQEYDLSPGDAFYLFSDGYPDQFGGPKGKKMKVERVKQLLERIHHLSMEEQYEEVKNYFLKWKGDHFQVDDVLFMGVRL